MKAKYIGKYYGIGFDKDSVYLQYEYRGHEYEVHENRTKGNEPLAWQHRTAQDRIDWLIDMEKDSFNSEPFDMDEIWNILGWE